MPWGRPDKNIPYATRSRSKAKRSGTKLVRDLAKYRRLAGLLQGYFYPGAWQARGYWDVGLFGLIVWGDNVEFAKWQFVAVWDLRNAICGGVRFAI